MTSTTSKTKYREWIRSRYGSIHQSEPNPRHKNKRWKINQNHIRDTMIDEYSRGFRPEYLITRVYHYDQQSRDKVVEDNKRMNNVVNDFFNPRGKSDYHISLDHFVERHKDKLVKKERIQVKDTILDDYEFDWRMEVRKGGFHIHTLISEISDEVVLTGPKKVRDAIDRIYGIGEIPLSLRDDEGLVRVKTDLLEHSIRNRCDFVSNSNQSIDIQIASEYSGYDGYKGWKGMVAYVTKNMYNVDNMVEIYDKDNSQVLNI